MDITPETRDVLRKAKGLVVKGWFGAIREGQGFTHTGRDGERHCVMTAIYQSCRSHRYISMCPAVDAVRKVVGVIDLADWNNTPGRTHEEVVAAFDKALGIESPPPSTSPTRIEEEVYA